MRVEQGCWTEADGWRPVPGTDRVESPQLVLYFAAPGTMESGKCYAELRKTYPDAHLLGCTTGGEILGDEVLDESVVAAAVQFEKTRIKLASVAVASSPDSTAAGRELGELLMKSDLQGVFVLSDGTQVNGSDLVGGITGVVGKDVPVTGGLAGDGPNFEVTRVGADDNPEVGRIAALGFYGSSLVIGHGSIGGWDDFGPERIITRSDGNVLYELDGQPALDLYKTYLGDEADNLPGSALLFPLKVRPTPDSISDVVRTVVGVDEGERSMTFAGNVPEGYVAQLMRGNFENLIEGAAEAARIATADMGGAGKLAILISCIGRKLLLGQRIGEEVEAVQESLGAEVPQIGFYSYGEISPHAVSGRCELHNQTMTITVLAET